MKFKGLALSPFTHTQSTHSIYSNKQEIQNNFITIEYYAT